ncbi:helix-turn-helix domain-containing protein [Gracilibacillus marinus]|uniref:Helix-turn-helix domain-containing protein n=1 Tax=Gracilibacillus marinus TaxID=630535 RepID=A0ABV8VWH0_9BACI
MKLYHTEEYSVKEIVDMTDISRATLYRYLNTSS